MNLKQMLTLHEGKRKKPYHCTAGKLTAGVGRNLEDVGLFDDEIDLMLENDIKRCRKDASNFIWFKDLDPVRQDVIISLIFNMGFARFCAFKRTIELIKDGFYPAASAEMLNSKWAKQVGNRAKELSSLMLHGDYKEVFK